MSMRIIQTALLAAFILSITTASAQTIADKAFINAKVYTADPNQSFAEAIAIKADTIVYVGTTAGAQAFIGSGTEVHDVNQKVILPGIHDVHIHTLEASSASWGSCALDSWAIDPETLGTTLANCNLQPNSNGWITAWGHSIFTLLDATRAPKEILDDAYPNTPVCVMEETSHSVWVNTAGLNAAGISGLTADPVGGHIHKWGGSNPSGILLDNAGDQVLDLAMAPTAQSEQDNYDGLVNYGLPMLAQNGITSMCEGRTYWKRNYQTTWAQVKADGLLTSRVVLGLWAYPSDDDATLIPALQSMYDAGDDMLRAHQLKFYSDGITINATAALHLPYNDNLGMPFNTGLNYFDAARLANYATILELDGFDFHVHAIGDRGVTEALDAFEAARIANGDIGARHRVTHLEIVDTSDYPRFAQLNVIADMQVAGTWTNPNHWHDNDFLLGAARADNLIPMKSLYDAGAHVTLSSDWDVSSPNPFVGMEHAVTRSPQNLPDVATAVDAYTIKGAYVMRQEVVTGSLEVGKYADLICIDRDIFTIPQSQIGQTQVTLTLLAGEEVYRDQGVWIADGSLQIREISKVQALPNITEEHTTLHFYYESQTCVAVELLDISGKQLQSFSHQHAGAESTMKLELHDYAEGIYLVHLQPEIGKSQTLRIVVSR
jgi:predicted amidohydrolase YtcJ